MQLNSIVRKASVTWFCVAFALIVCGLVGCGGQGPVGNVEGSVTLDGKPIPDGCVVMFAEGPGPFSGVVGADGKFTVPVPVLVGSYMVAVQQPEPENDEKDSKARKEASMKGNLAVFKSVIPEKYRTPQTSGMKFDVKEGAGNKFDFDMKSK